jgi:hypothetical protein
MYDSCSVYSMLHGFRCTTAGESSSKPIFSMSAVSFDQHRSFHYVANGTEVIYSVPDQAHVIVAPEVGLQSFAYSRLSDYVEMESAAMGISVGVSLYSASLMANAEVLSIASQMKSSRSHFLLAQEHADMYSVLLEPNSLPLDDAFVKRVESLPTSYNAANSSMFVSFLEEYGTHSSVEVTLGGRIRYKSFVSSSQAAEMSASNAKMHISLGFLAKKFPYTGADGFAGMSKLLKDAKPFATTGGLAIDGGDYSISTKSDHWFKEWAATVHRAPAVTRRRVEPLLTYMQQIKPSVASAYASFLKDYSSKFAALPTLSSLPIFFSWDDKPFACSNLNQLVCDASAPLIRSSTYYDSSYKADYLVASKMAEGRRLAIKWVSTAARVFTTQPRQTKKVSTPLSGQVSTLGGALPYYRHGRIVATTASAAAAFTRNQGHGKSKLTGTVLIPGLDQIGTGFDSLTGKHRLPVFDWSFSDGTSWKDGIIDTEYVIPDQISLKERFSSQPISSGIYFSSASYEQSLAQQSGISLWIPGMFSLDYRSSSTSQVFSGAESVLGVANKEYIHYALTVDNVESVELTASFKAHVSSLPLVYDEEQYYSFLRLFGTHVVTSAAYGGSARLWAAINYQLYSTQSVTMLQRSLEAHFGLLEAGVYYGTDSSSPSVEFSSNSFSWLSLGGGVGSEILTNQWSAWIRSTKIHPVQLSRRVVSIDTIVARLDATVAANVKVAISNFVSANQNTQQRFTVPPFLQLSYAPATKARGLYAGAKKTCYWHYVFDNGYSPRVDSELYTEFAWTRNALPAINKYSCMSVAPKGALVSCPLNSWAASTATASGGHQCTLLGAAPLSCCKLAYLPT